MGTYHSTTKQWEASGNPNGSKTLTREGVRAVFDYCLAHPEEGLTPVGVKHGLGKGTAQTWLTAPANLQPNKYLVEWFKEQDRLARWRQTRPRNRLGDRLVQAIGEVYQYPTGPEAVDLGEETFAFTGHERLVGPTGIGTFVPVATDDLIVMKQEALNLKAEAEVVALEANVLVTAIETVHDWLTDKEKLQLALGRLENLTGQLKESQTIIERFRQEKLATNQVHSSD